MRFRKDLGVALAQLLQYLAEFHGVGPVAGVGFVKQGDMIIAADQQPQTDLSQIDAASLVLAAPGEPGRGTSVDVGEEVGGVVDQGGGVDAPIAQVLVRFPSRWPGWLRAKVLPCGRKSAGCAVARDRRGAGDKETPPPPSGPAAPLVLGAGHDWEIGRAHRWNPVTATPRMPTSSFEKKQLTRDHSRHSET